MTEQKIVLDEQGCDKIALEEFLKITRNSGDDRKFVIRTRTVTDSTERYTLSTKARAEKPLVWAGTYSPPNMGHNGMSEREWCTFINGVIEQTFISAKPNVSYAQSEGYLHTTLDLFVPDEMTRPIDPQSTRRSRSPSPEMCMSGCGIPVNPALIGWVDTLKLPSEIKAHSTFLMKKRGNCIMSGGDEHAKTHLLEQMTLLLQHMYKMKMNGLKCGKGLRCLTSIFLLLANDI